MPPAADFPVQEMPPRGHYYAQEVGRLAGVSGNMVGQWKRRGYIRASQRSDQYPNVYAYQDIAEAMVVHELIAIESIDRYDIQAAIEALRIQYGFNWPLSQGPVQIADHAGLVITLEGVSYDMSRRHMWQGVLTPGNLRKLAQQLEHGGWAVRDLENLQHIEVNPDRLSGRPAIRGTRVFAETAAQLGLSDEGRKTLRVDFGLNDDQIMDAVRWLERVRSYEPAA